MSYPGGASFHDDALIRSLEGMIKRLEARIVELERLRDGIPPGSVACERCRAIRPLVEMLYCAEGKGMICADSHACVLKANGR